jgi:hypothetical protein
LVLPDASNAIAGRNQECIIVSPCRREVAGFHQLFSYNRVPLVLHSATGGQIRAAASTYVVDPVRCCHKMDDGTGVPAGALEPVFSNLTGGFGLLTVPRPPLPG